MNESASAEFDGHYADAAAGIVQIPEPSASLLFVSAAALIGLRRRTRARRA